MAETPGSSQSVEEVIQDFETASQQYHATSDTLAAELKAKIAAIDDDKANGRFEETEEEREEAKQRSEKLKNQAKELVKAGLNDSMINSFVDQMRETNVAFIKRIIARRSTRLLRLCAEPYVHG